MSTRFAPLLSPCITPLQQAQPPCSQQRICVVRYTLEGSNKQISAHDTCDVGVPTGIQLPRVVHTR